MNETNGIIRDARKLGVPKMLILGLQHMFAMFGATILVPILVNSYFGEDVLHVQVTLICAGLGTLFFHLCSKFQIPAFLGSSFAFLGGFATIANMDEGAFADMSNADKLSYACGGIVVAGLLYDPCADHQICRRKKGHAFPASGRDRTDHHLYRLKPCRLCHQQCLHQLAARADRTRNHYHFQYLGQGHV